MTLNDNFMSADFNIKENNLKGESVDITHHDRNLRHGYDSYSENVEYAGIGIVDYDSNFNIMFFNRQFAELFGYEPDEQLNTSVFSFVNPEDVDKFKHIHSRMTEEGLRHSRFEYDGIRKGGYVSYIEMDVTSIVKDGKVTGFHAFIWDITERKLSEIELAHNIERFRSFFNNSTIGIFRRALNGKLLMANPKFLSIVSAFSTEELSEFIIENPEDEEKFLVSEFKRLLDEKNSIIAYEEDKISFDGTEINIRQSAWKIVNYETGENFYDGILEDITKLRLAEKQKVIAQAELKKTESELKILSGLLPICANCKQIRNESGNWMQLEDYIDSHSVAEFSHGICPDCARRLYPNYYEEDKLT